jgi:hypothetical protein
MKKETSVEWLFKQFENGDMYNVEDAQRIKHQAKQMHKEEIENAWEDGQGSFSTRTVEQYYNETYGK